MSVSYKYSKLSSKLKNRILYNTGFMEGDDDYSQITGNFDKQGISFGIIQYNFGQETLAPLLDEYIEDYEDDFYDIFGKSKGDKLKKVVRNYSKDKQIAWGDSITSSSNKHLVVSKWRKLFKELGEQRECINLQKKHAKKYFERALKLLKALKLESEQSLAFCFDHAVQSWSFRDPDDYSEFMSAYTIVKKLDKARYIYLHSEGEVMPEKIALQFLDDYIPPGDARSRRIAIRKGNGKVHGKRYDIDDFNLSYDDDIN